MGRQPYPYSFAGQVMNFPWKYYWQNARYFRYSAYALLIVSPLFYKLHKLVNSPPNVRMWEQIRAKRIHDPFAPPTEHGGHH